MSALVLYAADLIAVTVLAAGIYWPRHRRRDLVVAFFGINVGVLAVAALLVSSAVTAGVGLGLFGVLSIIRLRSDELAQHEIAYYFATLALGLVGGLGIAPAWLSLAFMGLVLATMAVVDHPAMMARARRQLIVLDRAIGDEALLREHLEQVLGAEVTAVNLHKLDLVTDTTTVDVRYRVPSAAVGRGAGRPQPAEPTVPVRDLEAVGRPRSERDLTGAPATADACAAAQALGRTDALTPPAERPAASLSGARR